MESLDPLKLENQLCFPLYACAKEVVRKYTPFLSEIGLTYTQYIAMMVIWEKKSVSVKHLGEALYLDSGTLTPLLKKMEKRNLIKRERDRTDERSVIISVTNYGMQLREKALEIPLKMSECIPISQQDALTLFTLLHNILDGFAEAN